MYEFIFNHQRLKKRDSNIVWLSADSLKRRVKLDLNAQSGTKLLQLYKTVFQSKATNGGTFTKLAA